MIPDSRTGPTEVPCGMCDATGVAPPPWWGACEWCDGAKTVEAMGEWVPRSRLEKAEEERDRWIRLFNRLEAAVSRHIKAKSGDAFSDGADEALHTAHGKVLMAAAHPVDLK